MKITIDKEYTPSYYMDRVKDDAKEFSESFTIGNLLEEFTSQVDEAFKIGGDIIKYQIKAMDSGYQAGNKTIFAVDMTIDNLIAIYKVRFYIGMDLVVDRRNLTDTLKMYTIRKYELATA